MRNISVPEVSVVVTAYNEDQYIGRCLRSLLHQKTDDFSYEVLVVNDASSDKTAYALELFGDAINVLNNEINLGLPASINRAIKEARGEYIVRVDADDYVNINYLNFLKVYLDSNPHFDAVACDYLLVDNFEEVIRRCTAQNEPIGCGIMFKKPHLFDLGLYDESFRRHEDRDLRHRFDEKFSMGFLDIPLYRYRRHDHNMTNDLKLMEQHERLLDQKHRKK